MKSPFVKVFLIMLIVTSLLIQVSGLSDNVYGSLNFRPFAVSLGMSFIFFVRLVWFVIGIVSGVALIAISREHISNREFRPALIAGVAGVLLPLLVNLIWDYSQGGVPNSGGAFMASFGVYLWSFLRIRFVMFCAGFALSVGALYTVFKSSDDKRKANDMDSIASELDL